MADARKEWLKTYNQDTYVDHTVKQLSYTDFVNKELILFSVADCARSIPSLCDGLKPGQRKILYSCFKRKLKGEIKVAQLSGYVAEHSAYHHGEVSLQQTIVSMAQNFVASNNINLLLPIGQFGTRIMGGKDSASARYIFTSLNPVTRHLFPEADDPVLNYLVEEGQSIEPDYYLPIIPLALVNGAEGIGTGWSTFIPQHNPRDLVENIRRLMKGEPFRPIAPWYKGYTGDIEPVDGKHAVTGKFEILDDDELEITELPIGKWTRDYKNFLEELAQKDEIEEIREYHQENRVHFVLKVPKLREIERQAGGILKKFKLQTTLSQSNYVLFNERTLIQKYPSEELILRAWVPLRETLYERRKDYQLAKLKKELEILRNKVRFIKGVVAGNIKISGVKRKVIVRTLKSMGFATMSELNQIQNDEQRTTVVQNEGEGEEQEQQQQEEEKVDEGEVAPKEYDYLLTMPLWSLSDEKVEELTTQMNNKKHDHDTLAATHIHTLWDRDLDAFLEALQKQEEIDERDRLAHKGLKATAGGKRVRKKAAAAPKKDKNQKMDEEEYGVKSQKAKKAAKPAPPAKTSPPAKQVDPSTLSLRERLMLKANQEQQAPQVNDIRS